MSVTKSLAAASICLAVLIQPIAAGASEPAQALRQVNLESISIGQTSDKPSNQRIQKLLSDHPGSATALTTKQKTEIRAFVKKAKGKQGIVCTGLSLTGQRASMYRVVRYRAELVCDYAKSLNASLEITIQEKTTKKRSQNGRVVVASS